METILSKQENNMENIEETSWTTQIISKDDYYYYIDDGSEIRGIRKDQMDYKLVYKPEYNIHANIDSQCYSIYNNDIYFLENSYENDGDYKYLYKKDYNAIIKRNDTNTSEYEIFCSNEDILNLIGNEMKIYSIDSECLKDNYCYWTVTSENTTSKKHKIFILKKKLDGTENIQKVAEIVENADLVNIIYSKNYIHVVTSYSIYQVNMADNSLTNLYTTKKDKLSMEYVFFLSDEVII